jgi:hypothetical protein
MKTRRQKLRKRRGTRKQKGGAQIFLELHSHKNVKGSMTVNDTTTPRDVLEQFLTFETIPKGLLTKPEYVNLNNPLYTITKKYSGPLFGKNDWTKPFKFENGTTYIIKPDLKQRERINQNIEKTLPILKKVLDHYKDTDLKVIYASSAVTSDIVKNVNQQFKFHTDPKMPILLIDPGFFSPNQFDFYKYLKFEETTIDGIDPNQVKIYRKAPETPLEINPINIDLSLSNKEKKEYLAEVEKQAKNTFDLTSYMEICCLKGSVDFNHNAKGKFYDLLKEHSSLTRVFSFSE